MGDKNMKLVVLQQGPRIRVTNPQVFSSINGLLIPGGATSIYHSGYADASNAFFQMAKEVRGAS